MIQRAAGVRKLKADADLIRILQEYLLVGHHDKTGGIIQIIIDLILKHRKAMDAGRIGAADCCLALIFVFQDLLGRDRRVRHADLLPVAVFVQEPGRLLKATPLE